MYILFNTLKKIVYHVTWIGQRLITMVQVEMYIVISIPILLPDMLS